MPNYFLPALALSLIYFAFLSSFGTHLRAIFSAKSIRGLLALSAGFSTGFL